MTRAETRRSRRRRVDRQWTAEAGRRALAARPVAGIVIEHGQTRALWVTIEPDPAWPESLHAAWRDRKEATVSGRCRCGAVARFARRGEQIMAEMVHEPGCMVGDEAFTTAVGALGAGSAVMSVSGICIPDRGHRGVRRCVRSDVRAVRCECATCPEPCPERIPDKDPRVEGPYVRNLSGRGRFDADALPLHRGPRAEHRGRIALLAQQGVSTRSPRPRSVLNRGLRTARVMRSRALGGPR